MRRTGCEESDIGCLQGHEFSPLVPILEIADEPLAESGHLRCLPIADPRYALRAAVVDCARSDAWQAVFRDVAHRVEGNVPGLSVSAEWCFEMAVDVVNDAADGPE